MAGGNPYLDAYEQRRSLYGNPVGVKPRLSRRLSRLAQLQKLAKERQEAGASQTKYAEGFQEPEVESADPVAKRLKQYQDTWQRFTEDNAKTGRAPSQEEQAAVARMSNPLLVRGEIEEEENGKKAWDEYWNAVDKGAGEAIEALLPVTGQMWDAHRAEATQLDEARKYIATLSPDRDARLIKQYDEALEKSWGAHKKNEEKLAELSKRLDAGIARRAAAERELGAAAAPTGYFATIEDRLKESGPKSLAWVGKQLARPQQAVAAMLGGLKDLAQGQPVEGKAFIPGVNMFSEDAQARGALFNEEVGQAFESTAREQGSFWDYVPGVNLFQGGGVRSVGKLLAGAGEGAGIASEFAEKLPDWLPQKFVATPGIAGLKAARDATPVNPDEASAQAAGFAGQLAFEIASDPTNLIPAGTIGKVLKPLEPMMDALTSRVGIKQSAKALRSVFKGGIPLEDAEWARYAITSKSAEVTGATPFIEEAYKAREAIERRFAEIPPEIQPLAREAAPKLREGVPREEWAGGVKLQGAELPVDYQEIPVYHGTARAFGDFDIGAKRVAILDKPGRGGPVRGIFFSPHKDVAENYVRYAIPRVMAEARAGRVTPGVWRSRAIEQAFAERGTKTEAEWAAGAADRMFKEATKRNPLAWRSEAVKDALAIPEIALFSDTPVEGGRVFKFTPAQKADLEAVLLQIAQDPRKFDDKVYFFTKTPEFDPRVAQATLRGRVLDLTNAKAWPAELVRAIQKSSDSEDKRIAKVLGRAMENGGQFQKLNTVERSPALQKWVKEQGFDIVKKPEMDEITGEFSYWAISEEALGGGTKYKPKAVKSEALEQALKEVPLEHRAAVVRYTEAIADSHDLLKKMTGERLGRNVELSDSILEGYYARRWSPEAQKLMAENPEIREAMRDLAQAQHLHATGQAIPEANQFAKRKFSEGTTFHDAEQVLREKFGNKFKDTAIWSRDAGDVAFGDFVFAANAVKRQAQAEEFVSIFADDALAASGKGAVSAEDFFKRLNAKMPEDFAGKMIPESRVKEFQKLQYVADPGRVRQVINRLTGWVSRSVLATPASVSKDVKGQVINAALTDPQIMNYVDKAGAVIKSGKAEADLSELIAAGLDRPSFNQIITPSTIAATEEFGGGALGRAAGAIEQSGFTGATIRGVGKAVEQVPLLGKVGRGIQSLGKGVGAVGRASLDARQTSESIFRLATYKAAKARGLSRDEALREVAKWWGDFSQLSKLESNVLKGFVMFFSWQLRALRIGAAHLIDHPLRTRLFLALAAGNVSDDPTFPEWARRQGGTIIGRDNMGNPRFMSVGAGSYLEPISDLLQGEAMQRLRTDGFAGIPKGLAQSALRRLAPLAQAPIEYATNYDSFSGGQIYLKEGQDTAKTRVADHGPASALWLPEPLKKLFGVRPVYHKDADTLAYVHVDPEWNWLFNKLTPGVGAELATVNPLADPRKDAWEAAARSLGFPTYSVRPVDVQKQVANKVRVAREALRKSMDGTGLAMNEYGLVYFNRTDALGQQMHADNERWKQEAAELRKNPDAYLRFKMGAKYPEALRLIDLGQYLDGWGKGIESEQGPEAQKSDALKPLRSLGAKRASPR
jgi:hypothetical protein